MTNESILKIHVATYKRNQEKVFIKMKDVKWSDEFFRRWRLLQCVPQWMMHRQFGIKMTFPFSITDWCLLLKNLGVTPAGGVLY